MPHIRIPAKQATTFTFLDSSRSASLTSRWDARSWRQTRAIRSENRASVPPCHLERRLRCRRRATGLRREGGVADGAVMVMRALLVPLLLLVLAWVRFREPSLLVVVLVVVEVKVEAALVVADVE